MLQMLLVIAFWVLVYFVIIALSPVLFVLLVLWTIYKTITAK